MMQISTPCRSSWGANGYSEVWLNQTNDYAHKHLHETGDRMVQLAQKFSNLENENPETPKLKKEKAIKIRALNQCARELLLLQSSDWLFIITNGTMVDYAKKRIKDHVGRFTRLYHALMNNEFDKDFITFLEDTEEKDCIFPEIDYRIYC